MTIALVIIAVVLLVILILVLSEMQKAANNYPPENVDVIIILGCRVRGYTPSTMLSCRVDSAYKYLQNNANTVVIVSGGQGPDENISEAFCMKDMLVKKGISENRIFTEDKSKTTFQNISFSKRIIEENNLGDTIAISTSEFHQLRSQMVAKKLGINAYGIKAKTKLTSIPRNYLREFLALTKEILFNSKNYR